MATVLEKILRVGEGRTLKKLERLAKTVNDLEPSFEALTDEELREETTEFRKRLEAGETLDDLLPEAFAAVREAAKRTIGLRPFDVQVMGGANLHLGNISEMKTGEGKTLVATMPSYLNALAGKGVHVVTVNDYLASYQSELMGRVFRALGMTTGCIIAGQDPVERRKQYDADITYGTNNEFGFDYLRDNMASTSAERVQRGHFFAIIDEVDSILIDEARTPLIISGPSSGEGNRWFGEFARIAKTLEAGVDYEVDEKKRTVGVLEPGIEKVEDHLGITNLYESVNTPLISFLNNSIKAKALFTRDKDYVVLNGEVLIVDEHTGRILAGRRYNEGMHQAIEAKEGVQVKAENQMLATVTLQNFFRLYDKLSGMTGTAETEAGEFMSTYKLGVVPIPTNKKMQRIDQPDLVYKNEEAKFAAVVDDIAERHAKGQPVLVGTTSVEKSEYLSRQLAKQGVRHEVLNAKNHAREAAIIAQAGRYGAVTVATNMAGRGTDIMLGGNAEFLAVQEMTARGFSTEEDPEAYEGAWDEVFEAVKEAVSTEAEKVLEAGGLYVLGTERHESRRIDNQLRGRSGRQGDPGRSKFYLSLEDDLMRIFASERMDSMLKTLGLKEDEAIAHPWVNKALEKAQQKVEARNFDIRRHLLRYDNVMNDQRKVIYSERKDLMQASDLSDDIKSMRDEVINDLIVRYIPEKAFPEQWDTAGLHEEVLRLFGINLPVADWAKEEGIADEAIRERVTDAVERKMAEKAARIGPEVMRVAEKTLFLQILDQSWKEHLLALDHLRHGIQLRAYGQRDPLNEYKREAFDMFEAMMNRLREQVTQLLAHIEIRQPEPMQAAPAPQAQPAQQRMQAAMAGGEGQAGDGGNPASWKNVSRNAPCPCGSGKKYKHCHGKLG